MRVPVSALVLGNWVPIKYYKVVYEHGEPVHGAYHQYKKLIAISVGGEDKTSIKETILHELGHAIMHIARLAGVLGEDQEEAVVDLMAEELAQMVNLDSESARFMWEYIDLDTVPDGE